MKHLTLITVFFYVNFSYCQDYIRYHQIRMKAEKAILDTNYSDAVAIYDALFNEYDFVFAKHIYTATQTAIENNDLKKAFDLIKKEVLKGIKINEFDNDSILVKLKKTQDGMSLNLGMILYEKFTSVMLIGRPVIF